MVKIEGGYYIKARCIKNSAIANSPPYVREIWDYLLREANHTDNKYSGYTLKRGQLFRSYREIRDALSWKVGYRTERYNENQMKMGMRYLMKQLMITVMKQPRGNIITILNYDFFQNPKNYETTSETTSETTNGQPMGNQGVLSINKNDKKKKNDKKVTLPDWLPLDLWNEFKKYRTKIKKPLGMKAEQLNLAKLEKLKSAGNAPQAVIEQTIERGWQGFFELPENKGGQHGFQSNNEKTATRAGNDGKEPNKYSGIGRTMLTE